MTAPAQAIARAEEIAYVRFQIPDLSKQHTFLSDFGIDSAIEDHGDQRVLRGHGGDGRPFLYEATEGLNRFVGLGLNMSSRDDLVALSALEDASPITPIDAEGGGECVRFTDPNGNEIDAIFGQTYRAAEAPELRPPFNQSGEIARPDVPVRLKAGPARVRRLGHCVLNVLDFVESEAWYKHRFGLRTSDEIYAGSKDSRLGAFLRCDCGDTPVDHHTIFLIGNGKTGLNHVAFEVDDWDAIMLGHDHLEEKGYQAHWGVGKHILGSQVFDYWKDPFGHVVEHYTDGDRFTSDIPAKKEPVEVLMGVQWGPKTNRDAEAQK